MPTFTASRLSPGNTVFPTTVEIRNGFTHQDAAKMARLLKGRVP